MGEERPRVSVVVPTRDRPELLRQCVAALEAQTVAVEIVVVEDVDGRGPAWARNEGVRRARGEVVCFTDDDCRPSAGWAEALTVPIFSGVGEVATGPVLMGQESTAADRAWEAIVAYLQEQAAAPGTASPGFAVTANLAARRELLQRLPFEESFPAAAGEDRDWGERAARIGAAAQFVPSAIVLHRSGMGIGDFLRQQYRYGQGAARYRSRDPARRTGAPSFYLGLIRAAFRTGLAPGVLVATAQTVTLAGMISRDRKKGA
ncbi:MAG TPA: glycosyltransferase [Solirubrobacterales bacterium]|jgi:glycosyltransferase involved in cell wall biosynthesis|nr:glycosyltransferase [Solirubrobacterales bacterium]